MSLSSKFEAAESVHVPLPVSLGAGGQGHGSIEERTRSQFGPWTVPTWVKSLPFLAMHLACLAVFFVPATWQGVVLCAGLYFVLMFGITAG